MVPFMPHIFIIWTFSYLLILFYMHAGLEIKDMVREGPFAKVPAQFINNSKSKPHLYSMVIENYCYIMM